MKILAHPQKSPGWFAARAWPVHCASEAAAMMGVSPYKSRSDLIREKATGASPDIDPATQARFDRGHAAEASARSIIEAEIDDTLYPVTATSDDGYLLASSDGIVMAGDVGFEHKLFSEARAAAVRAGDVLPGDWPQCEINIHVFGLEKIIFVVSDGTVDKMEALEYRAVPGRIEQVMAAMRQFDIDVANYKHVDTAAAPIVAAPDELPSLAVVLFGGVKESNLADWKGIVTARIQAIKTDLKTDEDFALAAKTVTFLETGEKKLELVKEQALSQTASIDELFRTIDQLKAEMRAKRLTLSKTVETRKQAIRAEIIDTGRHAFAAHVKALNTRLGADTAILNTLAPDFATCVKSLRTVDSMRDAVDTAIANAKIAANEVADRIDLNLKAWERLAEKDHAALFPDLRSIVTKDPDDFVALVKMRIADHLAEQERRAAVKREQEAKAADAQHQREAEAARSPATVAGTSMPAAQRVAPIPQPLNWGLPSGGPAAIAPPSQPTREEIVTCVAEAWSVDEALAETWLRSIWSEQRAAA